MLWVNELYVPFGLKISISDNGLTWLERNLVQLIPHLLGNLDRLLLLVCTICSVALLCCVSDQGLQELWMNCVQNIHEICSIAISAFGQLIRHVLHEVWAANQARHQVTNTKLVIRGNIYLTYFWEMKQLLLASQDLLEEVLVDPKSFSHTAWLLLTCSLVERRAGAAPWSILQSRPSRRTVPSARSRGGLDFDLLGCHSFGCYYLPSYCTVAFRKQILV